MKNQNILIINSFSKKDRPLIDVFEELEKRDYIFKWLFSKKNIYFGPRPMGIFSLIIFIFLWPFLSLYQLFFLIFERNKIKAIICFDWNEKIIFTPLAKLLGIKMIWLEYPDIDHRDGLKFFTFLYRFCSRWATIVVFINISKLFLKQINISQNNIKVIPLGIKLGKYGHQDTIFSSLAKTEHLKFNRKYFTVGATFNFKNSRQIENLFQAIKICLSVIPNLQLIIIGDGSEKKNLNWLAKKMEIDNVIWFVGGPAQNGQEAHFKKWFNSFDIFVATYLPARFFDLKMVLIAMASGLSVVGFRNRGFEDIIKDKTGLLIEADNNEILANKIIELYQNSRLRRNLGENAREQVDKNYNIDKMVEEFAKILE